MTAPATGQSERSNLLRLWLMKSPKPASVHVTARDQREFEVEIKPGVAWNETAVSINALDPVSLEALGPDGKFIRAVVVADLQEKQQQAQQQQQAIQTALRSDDPETQRMIVFAEMIERAYARAYEMSQQTVQHAFTQQAEMLASMAAQAEAANRGANELAIGIRTLLIQQAQEAVAEAEQAATPSPGEQLIASFMTGQNAAAHTGQTEAAAKPNGKH